MRKKNKSHKNVLAHTRELFAFMDEHCDKPQVKRINAILELLVAIRTEKRLWEKAQLLDRLHEAFWRYRWVREIVFGHAGNNPAAYGPFVFMTRAEQSAGDDSWEYGAAHVLLVIAEHYPDYLSKIERCDVCGRWMLARKSDHRFCSGKCRQQEYDNDPEVRERKLAKMRSNYREERDRAERAKRRVGFLGKAPKKKARKSLPSKRHTP
jgi:hypothetical protein